MGIGLLLVWIFGRYVEERLGPVRMLISYFGAGALVLAATIPMGLQSGPIGGLPGVLALTGMTMFSAPRATVRTAVWLPFHGIWTPRILQIPVGLYVGLGIVLTILDGLRGDPWAAVTLAGLGVGFVVTWLLRAPIFRGTGGHLPREARGGHIQSDSSLDDADVMWRAIEAQQKRRQRHDGDDPPQVYDLGVDHPRGDRT